ncbi:uncharacterized protein EDB91DRAFT_1123635 [Suillus paluster]|uniref:uncharacterized protein n=1 Tax=Suillus paluster TaxID=48578 RepID=UPI001B869D67|nr:uncharacterized protein EDB91DRAFT_1123635 [Suillus paluster]KAG1744636.1 hypothetical protein EDB91DRAFT_1123635 [Suillus paluster]
MHHTHSSSSSQPRPILKHHHQTTPNYSRVIGSPERLHARGCPGRTYTLDGERPVSSSSPSKRSQHGIHLHPRAVFNHQSPVSPPKPGGVDDRTPWRSSPTQPPLIPDLSSESDESDGSPLDSYNASLKPAPSIPWPRTLGEPNVYLMTPSYDHYGYPNNSPNVHPTLPFLPYPPPNDTHKVRRQRQRDRSRERERERGSKYALDDGAHDKPSHSPFALCGGFSTSALDGPEDSCLGGF